MARLIPHSSLSRGRVDEDPRPDILGQYPNTRIGLQANGYGFVFGKLKFGRAGSLETAGARPSATLPSLSPCWMRPDTLRKKIRRFAAAITQAQSHQPLPQVLPDLQTDTHIARA